MVDYNVPSPPIDVLDELMENWSIYPAKPKLVFRFQCVPCKTQLLSVTCLLYTSPSPRDGLLSRMPSSA